MRGAPIRKCVRVDLNTQNDMSVGLESLFHFFGNLQPPFPSQWHLVAIVRNSQQRRIIFFLNPIGSDRWRWPVLKVVHMSHPTNVVIGSACCWARSGLQGQRATEPRDELPTSHQSCLRAAVRGAVYRDHGYRVWHQGRNSFDTFCSAGGGLWPDLPSSLSSAMSGSWGEAAVASRHRDRRC